MRVFTLCFTLVVAALNVTAQGWRGIAPLHSTCDEVKQQLGIHECKSGTYDVEDANVSILFSDGTCSSGWNVPTGTVVTIDVHSKTVQQFSNLGLDPKQYRPVSDAHLPGLTRYENEDKSVSITVSSEGLIMAYFYGPSAKDASLRCRTQQSSTWTGSTKFDEYGDISRKAEEERLNDFAFQLRSTAKSFLGYIITYHGGFTSPKKAHERAVRAKAYLISQGVEANRLLIVDGGERQALTIELFVTIKGTPPPDPRPQGY